MDKQELIISDLSRCEPASALADRLKPGCWRVVDYETVDGLCGEMLFSVGRHHSPTLDLPLNTFGPYWIFLGINYSRVAAHSGHGGLWVKLSGDRGYAPVAPSRVPIGRARISRTGLERNGRSLWLSTRPTGGRPI